MSCQFLCPSADPPALFVPGEFFVKRAMESWEIAGHFRLRREVFCEEQGIFKGHDRDEADASAIAIVASGCLLGAPDQVVGTVRIHELTPGHWQGSRLAVQRGFRRIGGLGIELIRAAVSTARGYDAQRFVAHVQPQNVALFERLHWTSLAQIDLYGRAHHLMQVDLARYPVCKRPQTRIISRLAA